LCRALPLCIKFLMNIVDSGVNEREPLDAVGVREARP
jgi:hypothetical protein